MEGGKKVKINVDQVRIYCHRKCDETEIGTGSSPITVICVMNQVVLTEYNGDQMSREMKGSEHRVNKRNLSSNDSNSVLPRLRKKNRREETVAPTTSGYNLRPRKGKREESRLTIERKTQQGGPVRSRKGRERNDSPYIEERTRSSNKNAR
ncbi:uncharacterized protein TNCV_3130261 [Trichonephila clavipes]|nr:uncharacterized protein TNCV_3130261 [Trichonephila clavipes]